MDFNKTKNQRIAELEEKIKQVSEEFNKQHELLDQYELDCTDEIIRLKNQSIAKLKDEAETYKQRWCDVEANRLNWYKKHHDLMEENAKLKKEAEVQKETILKYQQENAKLTEQLKTAVMPKYKVGQNVWFVDEDDGEIREARVLSIELEDRIILYTILWGDFCELYRQEEFLFETEEEAQNYVKEVGE